MSNLFRSRDSIAAALTRAILAAAAMFVLETSAYAQCPPPVQRLIADRRLDEARAAVQADIARAPNDDAALHCLGRVLLERGDAAGAIDALEKAVKINGRNAQ